MAANSLQASLRQAMLSERDGYQFYAMAATQAKDRDAAAMFEHLADEEMAHFKALQNQYQALLETGVWDTETVWSEPWSSSNAGRILSDDLVRHLRGKHLEVAALFIGLLMAALSIGLLMEKQAYEFYLKQALATENTKVRGFFAELAHWEYGHYEMLQREEEALKGQYWTENRSEPLL